MLVGQALHATSGDDEHHRSGQKTLIRTVDLQRRLSDFGQLVKGSRTVFQAPLGPLGLCLTGCLALRPEEEGVIRFQSMDEAPKDRGP